MCNTCGCSAAEEINPVESVVVPAPLGRGVAQFYSEGGDMATYAPSEEAEGSTPATEPTNANFSAESKSMFGKDKNGRMYARRRNGRIITHNAEHEGLYACSKCKHWNRNPVDDITKCKKCGNETFTFVKRSEFMPEGDGNVVGQQTFGFNGTPLHAEEDTSFGLVGEGNDFGQMRAEYEADYALEKPFTTGAKLSAGLLTGAALFGVVGASLTALLGSMVGKGE